MISIINNDFRADRAWLTVRIKLLISVIIAEKTRIPATALFLIQMPVTDTYLFTNKAKTKL